MRGNGALAVVFCAGLVLAIGCGGGRGRLPPALERRRRGRTGRHRRRGTRRSRRCRQRTEGCPGSGSGHTNLGQPCSCSSDCGSGFCVDGVCCNSACTGTCMSCSLPGSEGTCDVVPAGASPAQRERMSRRARPPPVVKTAPATAAEAAASSCSGRSASPVRAPDPGSPGMLICDGKGSCRGGPTVSCAPYTCGGRQQSVPDPVHHGQRLRPGPHLHRQQLREIAQRKRPLHEGIGLRVGILRRRRLLQRRLRLRVRVLQA